jgi:endonuclease G
MRITREIFEEVNRLLALRWSHRRIAGQTGVSRSTVNNIAHGYQPRLDESPGVIPNGPLGRCPGCGGRVFLPCVLCQVRALKAEEQRARKQTSLRSIAALLLCAIGGWLAAGASIAGAADPLARVEHVDLMRFGTPEGTICFHGPIASAFDGSRRLPRWTLELLTQKSLAGDAVRDESFHADPALPAAVRVGASDYLHSGFDVGHLPPAEDQGRQADRDQTFFYSLAAPQHPALNRGPWAQLEKHIRGLTAGGAQVWVITCPLFLDRCTPLIGPHGLQIPSHFGKSVLVVEQGGTLPHGAAAWIAPNRQPPYGTLFSRYRTSIDRLEVLSGLDLWGELPDELEARLEAGP